MKGLTRVFAAASLAVMAIVLLVAGPASAAQHHSRKHQSKALKVRILQKKQETILKHGLQVKVTSGKARKVKLSAVSSTFDEGNKPLVKNRTVKFHKSGHKSVKLQLTKAGKQAVKACAYRTIVARAGKAKSKAALTRNTKLCRLPEIEVKNASKCDFITNSPKATSGCMLPFPDDYYTTPDPSSETGLRINFQDEGMPSNSTSKARPITRPTGSARGRRSSSRSPASKPRPTSPPAAARRSTTSASTPKKAPRSS
jgi:hypothetical protein